MKNLIGLMLLAMLAGSIHAQELYVNTEPASNMARGAIGFRLGTEFKPVSSRTAFRLGPEVMFGISRHLMLHLSAYGSDFYQQGFKFEGLSVYGKYRFLAHDQAQSHFRMAAYARLSAINNPVTFNEISLQGDNSGMTGGLVITQLLHKVALSATTDFTHALNNWSSALPAGFRDNQAGYTLSAGYLLLPRSYTDYRQTNLNLYLEFLGKAGAAGSYLDVAPAVQLIFNSKTRLDFSWQRQLYGNLTRLSTQTYLLRIEYNVFNAFGH